MRRKLLKELFLQLSQQIWDVYRATDVAAFRVKVEQLRLWAEKNMTSYVLETVRKLCAKTDRFGLAYDHPLAHCTSSMLDRHKNAMAR